MQNEHAAQPISGARCRSLLEQIGAPDIGLVSWSQAHATLTNSGPGKPAPFSLMQLPRTFAASTLCP
jgi:hypothetical protein